MGSPTKRLMLLILLSSLFYHSFARDIISPSQSLADGEQLVSAGGSFALGFFSPKKSTKRYIGIWFNKITVQTIVWVANRENPITSNTTSLTITPQGTLTVTDHNSTVIWSMDSKTVHNPIAQLLDTGNFVVRNVNSNSADSFSWQSFDYPTDTFLPGMKLGWNLKTHVSRNFTSWKAGSDPSPGPFCLAMDIRGGHELAQFYSSYRDRDWRSGIWNGIQFSGIPDLKTYGDFIVTFVNNTDEIYVTYQMANPSTIIRIVMNYIGFTERYIWLQSSKAWNLIWYTPKSNPCDGYNVCGSNGNCYPNSLPVCRCLPGFMPKSPALWPSRSTSHGCSRKTALACPNGTDGFVKLSNVKLPDTLTAKIDASSSLDECRAYCLRNCSCSGYSNLDVRGTGCVMWFVELNGIVQQLAGAGQDLYVRLAASDLVDKSHNERQTTISLTVSLIAGALLLACISCCIWRKRKRT